MGFRSIFDLSQVGRAKKEKDHDQNLEEEKKKKLSGSAQPLLRRRSNLRLSSQALRDEGVEISDSDSDESSSSYETASLDGPSQFTPPGSEMETPTAGPGSDSGSDSAPASTTSSASEDSAAQEVTDNRAVIEYLLDNQVEFLDYISTMREIMKDLLDRQELILEALAGVGVEAKKKQPKGKQPENEEDSVKE